VGGVYNAAVTVLRIVRSNLTTILYYRGHPCDKLLCRLLSFEVRSVESAMGFLSLQD